MPAVVLMFKRLGAYRTNFPARGVSEGNFHGYRDKWLTRTIFLMTSPHIQVYVTPPCVIGGIKIGDLCKERAWIFCQWMKSETVDADDEELESQRRSVRLSWME